MVYFVVTIYFDNCDDLKAYHEYIKAVQPIVEKYHGRYLTRSENITALNVDWEPDRVILIEFDTKEQLDMCFSSEEYQEISSLRENSVTSKAIVLE